MQKTNNIRENQVHRATYTEERCALSSCIFMFFLFNTYRTSRNEIIRAVFFFTSANLYALFFNYSHRKSSLSTECTRDRTSYKNFVWQILNIKVFKIHGRISKAMLLFKHTKNIIQNNYMTKWWRMNNFRNYNILLSFDTFMLSGPRQGFSP